MGVTRVAARGFFRDDLLAVAFTGVSGSTDTLFLLEMVVLGVASSSTTGILLLGDTERVVIVETLLF